MYVSLSHVSVILINAHSESFRVVVCFHFHLPCDCDVDVTELERDGSASSFDSAFTRFSSCQDLYRVNLTSLPFTARFISNLLALRIHQCRCMWLHASYEDLRCLFLFRRLRSSKVSVKRMKHIGFTSIRLSNLCTSPKWNSVARTR